MTVSSSTREGHILKNLPQDYSQNYELGVASTGVFQLTTACARNLSARESSKRLSGRLQAKEVQSFVEVAGAQKTAIGQPLILWDVVTVNCLVI